MFDQTLQKLRFGFMPCFEFYVITSMYQVMNMEAPPFIETSKKIHHFRSLFENSFSIVK